MTKSRRAFSSMLHPRGGFHSSCSAQDFGEGTDHKSTYNEREGGDDATSLVG